MIHETPFYDELNIYDMSKAFEWYARSYKVEVVESKYPLSQLETSKSSIKGLFKDLLKEMKGFKYQITVKVLLKINKRNGKSEFAPVYFNYATKTVINFEYDLDKSFQEVLYRIDNPINEGSGWIIECIDDEYENISLYHSPLFHNQELHFEGIDFPLSKKDFSKIEKKNKICINVFCYENKLTYPVYLSDQDFMDVLLISGENKSYYV